MLRDSTVTAPNGNHWQVRRRWMDRSLPNLRDRFRESREEMALEGGLDALSGVDAFDSPWVAIAVAVGALLLFIVLLPLIGIALELIVLLVLLWSGIVGRVVLRRPWIVQAINLDDAEQSTIFAVKGWRRSGQAIEELAKAIATSGAPTLYKST
jgi:hypothetical protein